MKNYLKKAISAVIALALASSMAPAIFAAPVELTDVPETADYATAVNALVALDVVNGYEDNSFKPDNLITRAEASKIIVAALNETASAEAMKGATKFGDIEAKHEWATGYINKGVSLGYINGDENGNFDPDGNVTYAQVVKMMLCAMGYSDYAASLAEQYGYTGANWYIPYTQLAEDAGVSDGVYAGPNEAVTRAQVAQLVYNAIQAPIVKNVGVTYTDSGKIVPKIQIQDGEQSTYFKSILTEKFDAYYVEGYVSETQKDNTGLKADEVKFAIAKSKDYDEDDVRFTTTVNSYGALTDSSDPNYVSGRVLQKVYVGDTDAANYKATYATAIIMLDEYDDWTLLNFTPSGKNKSYTFDLKDLDDEDYESTDSDDVVTVGSTTDKALWTAIKGGSAPYIKFFVDGASVSTKYLLDATVDVYVNGVKVADTDVATGDVIWEYVINGDIGDIELVDTYKTNGKIDAIYVNSYVSGMVDGVRNDTITLDGADHGIYSLKLDEDDASLEYHIYYNGEEITINDLQDDDVLTIAYNVKASTGGQKAAFAASKFYEIYVSRDVVTDTLRGKNDEEYEARFGDAYYPFASSAKYSTFDGTSKLGDEYTLYLDAFGRVFKAEINSSAANWGIAEKFTKSSSDDDYKVTIFTADGTTKAYFFDAGKATVKVGANAEVNKSTVDAGDWDGDSNTTETIGEAGLNDVVGDAVYSNFGASNLSKNGIENRVITYKVSSSSGMITDLKFITAGASTINVGLSTTKEEFKVRNNTIGSIKLGDATKIIDATKYAADDDLFSTTVAGLTDEVEYEAYAYGTKIDGLYPFVLIKDGEAAYNAKTRFAVVTEAGYSEEEDAETGDVIYSVKALYGDATELLVSDDVSTTTLNTLNTGDVIYFKTNAKGYITDFDKIFSFTAGSVPSQTDLATWSLVANNTNYAGLATNIDIKRAGFGTGNFSSDFTTAWTGVSNDAIQLIYGPVIERTDADVTFAILDSNKKTDTLNASEAVVFEFANDVNVYSYDYSMGKDYRFGYSTATSAIVPSNILDSNLESDGKTIDWFKQVDTDGDSTPDTYVNQEAVNFAFAVVVEDEIVDIFNFIAK